jgi:uncharacterized iron-regulated membrane protein
MKDNFQWVQNGAESKRFPWPRGTPIYNTFYPIHTEGVLEGASTRVLQVVIGFSPLILLVTGYVMWKNRKKAKTSKTASRKLGFDSAAVGRDK